MNATADNGTAAVNASRTSDIVTTTAAVYMSDFLDHSPVNNKSHHDDYGERSDSNVFRETTFATLPDHSFVTDNWATSEKYVTTQNWYGTRVYSEVGDDGMSETAVLVITVVCSLIAILTAVSNLLILIAFCKTKKLRKPTNYFYVSLALSDCLLGVTVLPLYIYQWYHDEYWHFGKAVCLSWLAVDYFLFTASVYNIAAICLDRYLALFHGLWYRRIRTNSFVIKLIIVAWILGFVIEVPAITLWEFTSGNSTIDYNEYCNVEYESHAFYTTVTMFLSPIIPWVFITIVYVRIYAVIRRRMTKSDRSSPYRNEIDHSSNTGTSLTSKATGAILVKTSKDVKCVVGATPGCSTSTDVEDAQSITHGRFEMSAGPTNNSLYQEEGKEKEACEVSRTCTSGEKLCENDGVCFELRTTDSQQGISNNAVELEDLAPKEIYTSAGIAKIPTATKSVIASVSATCAPSKSEVKPMKCHNLRQKGRSLRGDNKAAILVSMLVASFLVFYTPWVVISIVDASCSDECLPSSVYNVAVWLQYANSLVNPFLYVFQDLNFRLAVFQMLCLTRARFK
ncbi:histamine H3 receptor-like [Ptychodera flava]|uniref:histamine H3 receptor-like n=1 Tax=Ptychodera flava TaxID=63121 RepID=UPI00396A1AAA